MRLGFRMSAAFLINLLWKVPFSLVIDIRGGMRKGRRRKEGNRCETRVYIILIPWYKLTKTLIWRYPLELQSEPFARRAKRWTPIVKILPRRKRKAIWQSHRLAKDWIATCTPIRLAEIYRARKMIATSDNHRWEDSWDIEAVVTKLRQVAV